jgi:hypothetical protein
MGITAGIDAGMGALPCQSILIKNFSDDIEWVTQSLVALQDQVHSLASIVLQNRCALDLLTAGKGGTCLFLDEECAFILTNLGWSET